MIYVSQSAVYEHIPDKGHEDIGGDMVDQGMDEDIERNKLLDSLPEKVNDVFMHILHVEDI